MPFPCQVLRVVVVVDVVAVVAVVVVDDVEAAANQEEGDEKINKKLWSITVGHNS